MFVVGGEGFDGGEDVVEVEVEGVDDVYVYELVEGEEEVGFVRGVSDWERVRIWGGVRIYSCKIVSVFVCCVDFSS